MNQHSELNIDELCELILQGITYRQMAEHFGVTYSKLVRFMADHSVRVRESLKGSADAYADKGEQVLNEAPGTMAEIQRARELAQHYRWRASKRNPKEYGDKIENTHHVIVEQPLFPELNVHQDNGNQPHLITPQAGEGDPGRHLSE